MSRELYNDGVLRSTTSPDDPSHRSQLDGGQIILAQASNCGWRACYGVDPNIRRNLAAQNQQLQNDVQHPPVGQSGWHPNMNNARNWNDSLDDPDARKLLNDMSHNGIAPKVFTRPRNNSQGYNPNGDNPNGYNPNGYNPNAYNPNAYNPNAYNPQGSDVPSTPAYQVRPAPTYQAAPAPDYQTYGSPPAIRFVPPSPGNNVYLGPVGDRPFSPPDPPADSQFTPPTGNQPWLPPPPNG